MIRAAGIMFLAGSQALLVHRSGEGDYEGDWAFPGGKIEEGETPEQAAVRECREELGTCPDGPRVLFARRADGHVDYQTFVQRVEKPFRPVLNDEHTGFMWADIGDWPKPLHPGAKVVLDKLTMNELDIAKAIVRGDLTSPQHYMNISLFAVRVTGTGTAYRLAHDEHVYRPPDKYLTDEFLERCNGLPIIYDHPEASKLNADEFADRVVGTLILPYISGSEVWGIAKIYDDAAATLMEHEPMSTSPAVIFRSIDDDQKVKLKGGGVLLIEGIPALLDHLAICDSGVWDKGGAPTGVVSATLHDKGEGPSPSHQKDSIDMPEMKDPETDEKALADKARKDAEEKKKFEEEKERADRARMDADAGQKLDQILAGLGEHSKRMDAMASRLDAMEKARKDSEESEILKEEREDEGDIKGKDVKDFKGATGDAKNEVKDVPKMDGAVRGNAPQRDARADAEIEALKSRLDEAEKRLPKDMPESEAAKYADAQARCDAVLQLHGKQAPRPMIGETVLNYRRRLANMVKHHSNEWGHIELAHATAPMLEIAEAKIYADATEAAMRPTDVPIGQFREVTRQDPLTGQRITRFHGRGTFFSQLSAPRRRVTAFVQHKMGA